MQKPSPLDLMSSSQLFLTPESLCRLLSVSRRTVRYWVSKKLLPPPWRLGPDGRTLRWHVDEVLEFVERNRLPN